MKKRAPSLPLVSLILLLLGLSIAELVILVTNVPDGDIVTGELNAPLPTPTIVASISEPLPTTTVSAAPTSSKAAASLQAPVAVRPAPPVQTAMAAPVSEPDPYDLPVAKPSAIPHPVPKDGLVGAWNFNECSGSNPGDQSGLKNKGFTNGAIKWVKGTKDGSGCALLFDDKYEYVTTAPSDDISIMDDIGISVWIRPKALSGDQGILDKTDNSLWNYSFYLHGNKLAFASTNLTPATTTSMTALKADNKWHHVAVTRKGTAVTFYIDGANAGETSQEGQFGTDFVSLVFGTHRFKDQFIGAVDDIRLYNRALSPEDIAALYADQGMPI